MATISEPAAARPATLLNPTRYERFLSFAALALLAAVGLALFRGRAQWDRVPLSVWAHVATILIALVLTPAILLRRRGDQRHRWLGRVWVVSMIATALLSFRLQITNPGHFSIIHILSAVTLLIAPRIWWTARNHQVAKHRRSVAGLVTGALLVAGFFTLVPTRLLGHWLLG